MLSLLLGLAFAEPDFTGALREMREKKVEISREASLGEGQGTFDSNSREIGNKVNCMTWMQGVIAEAYGDTPERTQAYLDSLRYYGDTISFGTRKHYIDRWLALEPAPLIPVLLESCQPNMIGSVQLDLTRFKQNHNYQGRLFAEDKSQFSLDFLTPDKMDSCLMTLPEGYYALFFVANEQYLKHWGKHGSMGQVHAIIIEKNEKILVHHASIDFNKVVTEEWIGFHKRILSVAEGYTIFGFDPAWQPKTDMKLADQGIR